MSTEPEKPNVTVDAITTVKISIKDNAFELTKEEAQELAKALVDSVGLPVKPVLQAGSNQNELFERYRKMKEQMDKARMDEPMPSLPPPRPHFPDSNNPWHPKIVWCYGMEQSTGGKWA